MQGLRQEFFRRARHFWVFKNLAPLPFRAVFIFTLCLMTYLRNMLPFLKLNNQFNLIWREFIEPGFDFFRMKLNEDIKNQTARSKDSFSFLDTASYQIDMHVCQYIVRPDCF